MGWEGNQKRAKGTIRIPLTAPKPKTCDAGTGRRSRGMELLIGWMASFQVSFRERLRLSDRRGI